MATVTADIVIDATGIADTNPFTDPLITAVADGVMITNGALKSPTTQYGGFVSSASPSSNVIESITELVDMASNDPCGPMLLNDAGNGYWLRCTFSEVRPYKVTNYVPAGTRMGGATNITFTALDQVSIQIDQTDGTITTYHNGALLETLTDTDYTNLKAGFFSIQANTNAGGAASWGGNGYTAALPSIRKSDSATFDKPAGIGTITGVTLNGTAITLDNQDATTFTVTDSDASITTSGAYDLVATGDTVETISVQVNVYGVAPSNNPLQKDGAALASLANVEVRVSAGATLAGSQLFYSGTATTDVSGNLGNIDLSSTDAADADPVLLSIRTAAGDSIIASETVGII